MVAKNEKSEGKSGSSARDRTAAVRHLTPGCFQSKGVTDGVGGWADNGGMMEWLTSRAAEIKAQWVLAFADDGVIWGRFDGDGGLRLSSDIAPLVSPQLRQETLQELRLFGEEAELLLWRDGRGNWRARVLRDTGATEPDNVECWRFDEDQILWGTDGELLGSSGFTLMTDGEQGMQHVVPLKAQGKWSVDSRPLRLTVRHYVETDKNGMARVVASRLVKIHSEGS